MSCSVVADADSFEESATFIKGWLSSQESAKTQNIVELLSHAHHLLSHAKSEDLQNFGLAAICHIAEDLPDDPMCKALLDDCICASRNFHYFDMLRKKGHSWADNCVSPFVEIQKEFYQTESGAQLTRQQKQLFEEFKKHRRLIVSAPTSFGKTRLLQEIILERPYKRVALVMPTIALITENVGRLKSDKRFDDYSVVNSTNFSLETEKLILVLTPEKLDLLLDEQPDLQFDFFSIDEIYKIQDDEDRKPVFSNVLYELCQTKADFYLIGPYFKGFSKKFLRKTGAAFVHYGVEVVQKEILDLHKIPHGGNVDIDGNSFTKAKGDETNLKRVLFALKDQQLIYQNKRRSAESLANKIAEWSNRSQTSELIEYIKDTVAADWSLVECLEKGVAFHHGAMPRFIQSQIVESFNLGEIRSLVCTTTLTEGVNTTAKNVILYSNQKGDQPLTGFDYKNLKGRAGRFLHHFVGNVIAFHPVVESEHDLISFYYFDSDNIGSAEVISIEEADLSDRAKEKRQIVLSTLNEERIPVFVVKANKYIPVEKQIPLVNYLRKDKDVMNQLIFHGNLPDKNRLDSIMNLCFDYIFSKRDHESQSFPIWQLKRMVNYYVYLKPTLKELIRAQDGAKTDTKVRNAFSLISHFFEFALPKYLTCFENLYNFVAQENRTPTISLGFVTTRLQYGFTHAHEIALKDAGVPDSIITKVTGSLDECRTLEEIRLRLRFNPEILDKLTEFEKKMFNGLV